MSSLYIWRGIFIGRWKLCIIQRVIEMSDKKTKVECRLVALGTDKINAKVIEDLVIPDPEDTIGKQIILDVTEEEIEDDNQSDDS